MPKVLTLKMKVKVNDRRAELALFDWKFNFLLHIGYFENFSYLATDVYANCIHTCTYAARQIY